MKREFGCRGLAHLAKIACACLLLLGGQVQECRGATLSSLLAGDTLSVANSRFSQWQVVHVDTTAAALDFAQIQVNPLVVSPSQPGVEFLLGTQLSTSGVNAIDLVLRFRVDALSGTSTFTSQSLELTSHTFGGTSEVAYVSSEMSDGVATDLGSAVVNADNGTDVVQLYDMLAFTPKSQVFFTMNVFVTGTSGGDQASIDSLVQRLAQNGAPGKPGDYNQNGAVDAADYTLWRNKLGMPAGTLPNDSAGGTIGMAQYILWKSNFGMAGSGSESLLGATVPEPATGLALWGTAIAGLGMRRRKSFR